MSTWREREGLGPERPVTGMPRDDLVRELLALRRIVDYQGRVFCAEHTPYGDETPNGHGCPCCVALQCSCLSHVYGDMLARIAGIVQERADAPETMGAAVNAELGRVDERVASALART